MRRLPPLNGLRAFEAAARSTSFVAAAEELNVTASAVSQQVQKLEQWLGTVLFRRRPKGLALTEAGRLYLPAIEAALDRIDEATRRLQSRADTPVITVTAPPSFATQWLLARLPLFTEQHPEIDVRLATTERIVDPSVEDVDLAIRDIRGEQAGLVMEVLVKETLAPVCAPGLLDSESPLRQPADLLHHRLLFVAPTLMPENLAGWRDWFAAAGVVGEEPPAGRLFSYWYLTIMEAVAGRGVALGPRSLVLDELKAGRLVAPFNLWIPAHADHYLAYRPEVLDKPPVAEFRQWLIGTCRETIAENGTDT